MAHGLGELSVPAVAAAAGVSLRTVYNYFDSKDALLEAVEVVATERLEALGVIFVEHDLDRLGDAIRLNWPLFGALGTLGDAWAVLRANQALARGEASAGTTNTRLDAALRAALDEATPGWTDDQQQAMFALIRRIVSSESFYRMRQSGVDADLAGTVTAWAFETLAAALRDGAAPFAEPSSAPSD